MNAATRRLVRARAKQRCEYCQFHEDHDLFSFHVEHIIAKQHGGNDDPANLAWSCQECNGRKGPNLSGRLRDTGEIVPLFNPRTQRWRRHFRWVGSRIEGKTKAGVATLNTLHLNARHRVALRDILAQAGLFPPED